MSLFFRQYTIGDLMNIDASRQEKAAGCAVELVSVYHEIKRESVLDKFKNLFKSHKSIINAYYVIFKLLVHSPSGSAYTVIIRLNPDFNLQDWTNNKIKIYCNCPDFKYRSAYILNKHDSLFLNDKVKVELGAALTDAPKSKSATTLLCKHSFAALQWLVNNYTNLMRTV